jgi:hypothetical protein
MHNFETIPLSKKIEDFQTAFSNDTEETTVSSELIELLNCDPDNIGVNYDTEPDIYTYNILGRTGSFIFGTKEENATTHPILLIPYYPIKIEYLMSGDASIGLLWFKITDENGIEYLFEEREITNTNSAAVINETAVVNNHLNTNTKTIQNYTSAWYMTKITNTFNETIDLTYQPFKQYLDSSVYVEYQSYDDMENFGAIKNKVMINSYINVLVKPHILEKHIETIVGPNTKISFNYFEKRKDITELPYGKHPRTLNEIVVSQNNGDLYNKNLRSFSFNYSYFETPLDQQTNYPNNVYNPSEAATKRLKLDGVTVYNGNEALPPYQFEYDYDLANSRFLPSRYSMAKDIWGYTNYQYWNYKTMPPSLWVMPIFCNDKYKRFSVIGDYSDDDPDTKYWDGSEMLPNEDAKKIGSLTKIIFPNGGSLGITYESDNFRFSDIDNNFLGGGLRVKELRTFDGSNTELTKSYNYNEFDDPNNNMSSGRITSLPIYGFFDPKKIYVYLNWRHCHYVRTNINLNTIDNENVLYENVEEIITGNGSTEYTFSIPGQFGELSDLNNNGDDLFEVPTANHIRYPIDITNAVQTYTTLISYNNEFQYPYLNNLNYNWNRGQLDKVRMLDETGFEVQRLEYEYLVHYPNENNYESVYGLKVGYLKNNIELTEQLIAFGKYKIATQVSKKIQSKKVWHYNDANVFTTTTYSYNQDGFISEVNTIDGNNESSSTKFKYILDYWRDITLYSEPTQTSALALFWMATQHNINRAVETTYYKNNSVTSAVIDIFKPLEYLSEIIVPSESWVLETDIPIQNYTTSSITDPTLLFQFNDNNFERVTQYNNYDEKGNLLDANIVESLYNASIYSYNNTYPVATIENARNVDDPVGISCGYTGFESGNIELTADNNYWQIGIYGEIFNTDAHTGTYSLKLNNVGKATWSALRTFIPEDQERIFEFSAWVKNEIGMADNSAGIGYELYDLNDNLIPDTWQWISFKDTYNEWIHIHQTVDLKQIKIDNNITEELKIVCFAVNYDNSHYVLIDDIRFVPKDAFMTTYTYEPGIGVTSVTDANNITQKILYDDLGRKKNVIDHNGNTLNNIVYNLAHNQLSISERNYDFGNLEINHEPEVDHSFYFTNTGNETIILNIDIESDESYSNPIEPDFILPTSFNGVLTILPGETEELTVFFSPKEYGERNATILITSLQIYYNQKLHVTGNGGNAHFYRDVDYEFYPIFAIGSSTSNERRFINRYAEPIAVTFSIDGSGSSNYSLDIPNSTITIDAYSSETIPVIFSPLSVGYKYVTLTATFDKPGGGQSVRTVNISGFGYIPITFNIIHPNNPPYSTAAPPTLNCVEQNGDHIFAISGLQGNSNITYVYQWYAVGTDGNWKPLTAQSNGNLLVTVHKGAYCYDNKFQFKCVISQFYQNFHGPYSEDINNAITTKFITSVPSCGTCSECDD